MKTRKFCPKCGRPVLKSRTKGYAFQCLACDEDFFRFEVYRTKDIIIVRKLQRTTYFDELTDPIPLPVASVKKPYRRLRPTYHQNAMIMEDKEIQRTIISRSILDDFGYDSDKISDEQLETIATELLDYFIQDGFRDALESTMSSLNIKKKGE